LRESIRHRDHRRNDGVARNSREHRRRSERSTLFNGDDSIQHKVDALFLCADGTDSHVINKIVIGDPEHIHA